MLAYIYIHTHTSNCRRYRAVTFDDIHTHTHTHAYRWSYICTNAHTHLECTSYRTSRSATITHTHTHTHTQVAVYWKFGRWWHTHPYPCPGLIACTNIYFFFSFTGALPLHACLVARNWRPYFNCATSLLSRDSRIADCTVRHTGVERPFSSLKSIWNILERMFGKS